MHDRTTLWLTRYLLFRFVLGGVMELGRSYFYKRAMCQQEKGGKRWRVVKDVVKHGNGSVTNKIVESGLARPDALSLAHKLNKPNGAYHG